MKLHVKTVGNLSLEETTNALEGLIYYFFLELYVSGDNIDTLITNPKSEELIDYLLEISHNRVLSNTEIISSRVRNELIANKIGLYVEFINTLMRCGFSLNDETKISFKEAITAIFGELRSVLTIPPTSRIETNVNLLLISLPASRYNDKGVIVPSRNGLNQPRLVDYYKARNILINELSNIASVFNNVNNSNSILDTMLSKLDNKYKTKTGRYKAEFVWIQNLKYRLKYEDKSGSRIPVSDLTKEDLMLGASFLRSFTNAKVIYQVLIRKKNGHIFSYDPILKIEKDRVKKIWFQHLIENNKHNDGLFFYNNTDTMILDRTSKAYRDLVSSIYYPSRVDFNTAFDILDKLGVTFSAERSELHQYQNNIRGDLIAILEQIRKGNINSIDDLYGNKIVGGRINNLLSVEFAFAPQNSELSFKNAKGKVQYAVVARSILSDLINTINSVKNLQELVTAMPWLGKVENGQVAFNAYQLNSQLLKPAGNLFNRKGERNSNKLTHLIISGIGADVTSGVNTGDFKFPERIADKIHYLLGNYGKGQNYTVIYSIINSDKSTENGLKIPGNALVSLVDVKQVLLGNPDEIVSLYTKHLTDEMASAVYNKKYPSDIQYYKDQVKELSHFKDILGEDLIKKFQDEVLSKDSKYAGDNAHIKFLNANKKQIDEAITKYLNDTINRTKDFFIENSIFEKQDNGLYTTDALDNESLNQFLKLVNPQLVNQGFEGEDSIDRHGYTEGQVEAIAGYVALNEEVLNTEQHKLIYGHPELTEELLNAQTR